MWYYADTSVKGVIREGVFSQSARIPARRKSMMYRVLMAVFTCSIASVIQNAVAAESDDTVQKAVIGESDKTGIAWVTETGDVWSGFLWSEDGVGHFEGVAHIQGRVAVTRVNISLRLPEQTAASSDAGVVFDDDSYAIAIRSDGSPDGDVYQVLTPVKDTTITMTKHSSEAVSVMTGFFYELLGDTLPCDPTWSACNSAAEAACGNGRVLSVSYSCNNGAVSCSYTCKPESTPGGGGN